jgi:aminomethyltransferase
MEAAILSNPHNTHYHTLCLYLEILVVSSTMLRSTAGTLLRLRRRIQPPNNAPASSALGNRSFAAAAPASPSSSSEQPPPPTLVRTSLYSLHKDLGGDMVPFAGYELPVLYKSGEHSGVMKEHLWCRSSGRASLFDVSHMGQIRWHGKDRASFLETVVVGDIGGLDVGSGCLSLVTNENGGIIDDTVITNAGGYVYMVVNGATKFGDMAHFEGLMADFGGGGKDVSMEYLGDDVQLLAVQGPGAADAVARLLPEGFDLTRMAFMTGAETTLDGVGGCRVTR